MPAPRLHASNATANSSGNGAPNGDRGSEKSYASIGVRYGAMNWIGEFRVPSRTAIKPGAKVVIQSDRGIELGEQVTLTCPGYDQSVSRNQIRKYVENSGPEFYRLQVGKVLREASPQDIDEHQRLNRHLREDIKHCKQLAAQLNLDMKVITAEHLLGGERIVFYFRSDGRVDFRELVRELAQYYQTRIEMRQVGARDEARLIADYEVCGRECCCKNFLKKLRPITMRMAKLQKSTLDPSKVSGRCGRLRCCLRYEHEGYDELARKLPRVGARVQTEAGPATVIDRQVLTQLVLVRSDDERELAIPVEEISPLALDTALLSQGLGTPDTQPAAPPRAAETPPARSAPEQQDSVDQEARSRRRHRPRHRPKSSDDDLGRSTESAPPGVPASEAPPETTATDRDSAVPAEEPDKLEEKQPPPPRRRRRRRRRPRHNQSDTPPGADKT